MSDVTPLLMISALAALHDIDAESSPFVLLLVFEGVRPCLQSGHARLHDRLALPEDD